MLWPYKTHQNCILANQSASHRLTWLKLAQSLTGENRSWVLLSAWTLIGYRL